MNGNFYSLSQIRDRIFTQWTPSWKIEGADRTVTTLDVIWSELRAVSSVGAWSSTVVQAGRLLEHFLSRREEAIDSPVRRSSISALLNSSRALQRSPAGGHRSHYISGDSLRRLRNAAAHYDDLQETTELAATQAIVIAVIFASASFGVEPPHRNPNPEVGGRASLARVLSGWRSMSSTGLCYWLICASSEELHALLEGRELEIFKLALGARSMRNVSRLPQKISPYTEYHEAFAAAFNYSFPQILETVSISDPSQIRRLAASLGVYGLSNHRSVLNSLMPYDREWLVTQLREGYSIHLLSRVLKSMRESRHAQWRLLSGTKAEDQEVARSAWSSWDGSAAMASNLEALARACPKQLRYALISNAPLDSICLQISGNRQVQNAVHWAIAYMLGPNVSKKDSATVLEKVLDRLSRSSIYEVRHVPLVVHRTGIANRLIGEQILSTCLLIDSTESERRDLAHLLFSVWLRSYNLRNLVALRARRSVKRGPPDWNTLVLLGICALDQGNDLLLSRRKIALTCENIVVPAEAGKAEIGLAALGIIQWKINCFSLLARLRIMHRSMPSEEAQFPRSRHVIRLFESIGLQ